MNEFVKAKNVDGTIGVREMRLAIYVASLIQVGLARS
jgi:hypothetical protein